jgi:hypothetical protein
MPSMTDYMVLSDGTFKVTDAFPESSQKVLTFTLPSDFTAGTNFARPVLAYIVKFTSSEGSVGVWVNPELPLKESQREQTLTWSNPKQADSGLWEVINGTKFKPGAENTVVFAIQDAEKGTVTFRDVVLWFQRGSGT